MELDPRTLMFVTACMGPIFALVLMSMRRTLPANIQGLELWALGTGLTFLGVVLITLRGTIPLALSVAVGNGLVIFGGWMWLAGTKSFLGLHKPHNGWWIAMAAVLCGLLWFLLVQPNIVMRAMLISLVMAALLATHARLLLRQPHYRYAARFVSFALLASALNWLLRVGGVLTGLIDPGLFTPSPFNSFVNVVQTVSGLLTLVGFVLLASERVRHDFEMLASKDSLTGALLRRAWNAAAQAELGRSRRHQRALSVVAMDLDHFKQVNDSYGHAVGDQVLVNFVGMVNQHLRSTDQLGRIGGEEFVLLLPETTLEDAALVAERIRQATQSLQKPCAVTVSMGVAHLTVLDTTLDTLMERADAALYRAKGSGRNQVAFETAASDGAPLPPEVPPIKSALRRT